MAHWAADEDSQKVAAAALARFDAFQRELRETDFSQMELATFAYYGRDEDGNTSKRVGRKGKQDQIRYVVDNEFRTVVRNKLTLATSAPGGFLPVPVNTDAESSNTSITIRGVLDYYFDEQKADKLCKAAAEVAEVAQYAWLDVPWDSSAGPVVAQEPVFGEPQVDATQPPQMGEASMSMGPPEGMQPQRPVIDVKPVMGGDVALKVYLPTDVAYDIGARGAKQWLVLETHANKYDLAANYLREHAGEPDAEAVADRISTASGKRSPDDLGDRIRDWAASDASTAVLSDEVTVYELRHLPTPGCPQGRWMRFIDSATVLDDGPARYGDDLACYRIDSAERFGTTRAYTSAHDMLGLQRVVDTLTSIPYSNQAAMGLNILLEAYGSEVEAADVREGLVKVTYKGGPQNKPEVMQLVRTSPEVFSFLDKVKMSMARKAGQEDAGRVAQAPSGAAMMLLDERTQRAVSDLADAYNDLRKDVANALIRRFRQFAKHSRKLALLVGKTKRASLGEFSGKDFEGYDRVKVERVSALMRQPSGRYEVANMLIAAKAGGIQPELILSVLETGKYEAFTEAPMAAINTIREENERMLAGEELDSPIAVDPMTGQPNPAIPPTVATALWTHNPIQHITEHAAGVGTSKDPKVLQVLTNHCEAHVRMALRWMTDPLMQMVHGPPPQMAMPGMAPPGQPGATDGTKPPESGSPDGTGPKPPQAPKNPATGERWSPTGAVGTEG